MRWLTFPALLLLLGCAEKTSPMPRQTTPDSFDGPAIVAAKQSSPEQSSPKQTPSAPLLTLPAVLDRGALVVANQAPPALPPLVLPSGPAGKLLGEVLAPMQRPGVLENPSPTLPSVPRPRETALDPLLTPLPAPRPRLSQSVRPIQPQTAAEETLGDDFPVPMQPVGPPFTPGERARESCEDARVAPQLPYLVGPPVDRVPLDDPTLPAATQAILLAPIPVRTTALPFEPIRLPEPYEFRKPLLTAEPEEDFTPIER
ncbi:MAG: hypothetical protein SNJ75_05255 [Gemmataceae bacterium]